MQKEAEGAECSSEGPEELPQTSHYLLIPNNAGLCPTGQRTLRLVGLDLDPVRDWIEMCPQPSPVGLSGVNFLIPAGQPPAGVALNPTLAVPYVLVPSTALSHYPLLAGGLPPRVPDSQNSHPNLSFGPPNVTPHPRYTVGAAPYGFTAGPEKPPPATPERSRLQGTLTGTPNSPSGLHRTVCVTTPEPLVG